MEAGTVYQTVTYSHEQIQEILREKAKERLKGLNGKDPVGTSKVEFTGTPNHDDTHLHIAAQVVFADNSPKGK